MKILFYQNNAPSHTSVVAMARNTRITVWTAWPTALLTRSSPKRHIFVSSSKKCARRTEFFLKWRGNHLHEQLFYREKRWVLFGRVTEMGASLGEVCRVTRRLCWKIKEILCKNVLYLCWVGNFSDHPRICSFMGTFKNAIFSITFLIFVINT